MNWDIKFKPKAQKEFDRLDKTAQKRILRYLLERVACEPKAYGEALTGSFKGLWRYRVGDYRVIVDIQQEQIVVAVLRVAKRSDVYEFDL